MCARFQALYDKVLRPIVESREEVVIITLAGKLSGTAFESAVEIADRFHQM